MTDRASREHVARFILVGLYTGSRSGDICRAALTQAIGRGFVDLDNGLFYRRGLNVAETKKRTPTIQIPPTGCLLTCADRARLGISKKAVVEFNGEPVGEIRREGLRARR